MQEFLVSLLDHPDLKEKLKLRSIYIRPIQDKKELTWIFTHLSVEQLDITIHRPNPDDGDEAEKSIEEELNEQNIAEYFVSQKAEKGASLNPNGYTTRLMEQALTNGHVQVIGRDAQDNRKIVDTIEKPLVESYKINGKKSYFAEVYRVCCEFLDLVINKN
jgi:hypothetical protein